jgi:hypothetical protein
VYFRELSVVSFEHKTPSIFEIFATLVASLIQSNTREYATLSSSNSTLCRLRTKAFPFFKIYSVVYIKDLQPEVREDILNQSKRQEPLEPSTNSDPRTHEYSSLI